MKQAILKQKFQQQEFKKCSADATAEKMRRQRLAEQWGQDEKHGRKFYYERTEEGEIIQTLMEQDQPKDCQKA